MRIQSLSVAPLSVRLYEPFVIASGRVDATRAVLVTVTVRDDAGRSAVGLGEAAALPPVTLEDQPDILATLRRLTSAIEGASFDEPAHMARWLDGLLAGSPVARAGLEGALCDAWARLADLPLCAWLTGAPPSTLATDITLPIAAPSHMAELASRHFAAGFGTFKVKVGVSIEADLRALEQIAERIPAARFRLDANGGFDAAQALRMLAACATQKLTLECFEQPCARDDLAGMARVRAATDVPIIADESVGTLLDLERVAAAGAADGVNLKLSKSGLLGALHIGQRARALGMRVMCGGMVETRLGMSTMAHVACALGGVDYIDLDTAFLLAEHPFTGGYTSKGAQLQVLAQAGHGVALAAR